MVSTKTLFLKHDYRRQGFQGIVLYEYFGQDGIKRVDPSSGDGLESLEHHEDLVDEVAVSHTESLSLEGRQSTQVAGSGLLLF